MRPAILWVLLGNLKGLDMKPKRDRGKCSICGKRRALTPQKDQRLCDECRSISEQVKTMRDPDAWQSRENLWAIVNGY